MTTLGTNISRNPMTNNDSWHSYFAEKLLAENFLLTALEFHAELTEYGKELPKLKDYFSNPSNFEHQTISKLDVNQSLTLPRSSSQATLDSLDLTRYSDDGERSNDDRVAVLEFELRKAKETIHALRANLTEAAESEASNYKEQEKNLNEIHAHTKGYSSIKPHEQRALNFLINEYLLLNGYKLTSITFADENENQDFDDWNDVGLNSARPLELLYLYREGVKSSNNFSCVETKDFECQVALYDEIQKNLLINELESEVAELKHNISSMSLEYFKKLCSLERQKVGEVDSQSSLTPDPEYFEIIESIKSQEESETRSDRSNGDWTKIGCKSKKESLDLRSDSQSNFESVSNDEKVESQSRFFDATGANEDVLSESNKLDELQVEEESEHSLEDLKIGDSVISDGDEVIEPVEIEQEFSSVNENTCKEILSELTVNRKIPERFKNEIFKQCNITIPELRSDILYKWFQESDLKELTTNYLLEILSKTLIKIIPNIILNKREEIIPILILSVCFHPDLLVRDKLLNLLFNLKKKPQVDERKVILEALFIIAQLKGSSMVENEILPQCWEQITHKYVERRLLVAESCFILAPYVSESIRNSLIISITQQLLQDREEAVRKASVSILTILIALMSDEDKYIQVLEICLQAVNDESTEVVGSVVQLLFPTLAQWSFTLNKIQSDLFSKLLNKIKEGRNLHFINVLETLLPYLVMTVSNSDYLLQFSSNSHPNPAKRQEFCHLCKGLCDPALFFTGSLSKVMGIYDFYTSQSDFDSSEWLELEWIMQTFIPGILEAGDNSWDNSKILIMLTTTLRYFCLGLGKNVTKHKVKPFLLEKLVDCENSVVCGQSCQYSIIPLYLAGVLSTYPEELQEMSNTLRRFICALPLCGVSLIPLQVAVKILSQYHQWQILVLDAIWEGVVHQRHLVRSGSASLLTYIIPHIPEGLLSTKVMPALVTLTSDPEPLVRTNAVPALGMLVNAKEKAIKDKVYITFQILLQDSIATENISLIVELVKMLGSVYESIEQKFKEDVIVPQLSAIVSLAVKTKSKDLIEAVIDVFSTVTLSQTQVSLNCMGSALLPGLRQLETLCNSLNLPYSEHIDSLAKEVERRLSASKERAVTSTTSPTSEAKRLANVVSSYVVVEDVKTRVTKIFNPRPNKLQNVSGIFKKKT